MPHPSDDVHALTVMFYQLLLGNIYLPLGVDYHLVLARAGFRPELIDLISRGIASQREDRYPSAVELAADLDRLPEQLIAPRVDPKVTTFAEVKKVLLDAKTKNAQATQLLEQRKPAEALAVLESIPVEEARDAEVLERALAYRDGKLFVNSIGMEFAFVPKGTFWMGGGGGQCGSQQVTIPHDFYIGIYPVTQEEWYAVTGKTPSHFRRGGPGNDAVAGIPDGELKRFPVECVSWDDCQKFIKMLNDREQNTGGFFRKGSGWLYRLPREAEWEYICREGVSSQSHCSWHYYLSSPTNDLSPQQANFGNSLGRTTKVGSYSPNRLGIYDLHGNVWEWCEDLHENGSARVAPGRQLEQRCRRLSGGVPGRPRADAQQQQPPRLASGPSFRPVAEQV